MDRVKYTRERGDASYQEGLGRALKPRSYVQCTAVSLAGCLRESGALLGAWECSTNLKPDSGKVLVKMFQERLESDYSGLCTNVRAHKETIGQFMRA